MPAPLGESFGGSNRGEQPFVCPGRDAGPAVFGAISHVLSVQPQEGRVPSVEGGQHPDSKVTSSSFLRQGLAL